MKTIRLFIPVIIAAGLFSSCGEDFLTANSTNSKPYGTDPITEQSINANLSACYHMLVRDNYGGGLVSVLVTSDVRSDDVFKGGASATDGNEFARVATFNAEPSLVIPGFWEMHYRAVARCNETIANADQFIAAGAGDVALVQKYREEAIFLRAYFMHWLWKNWGNVPYPRGVLKAETDFMAEQYTADEVYQFLMEDIAECEAIGKLTIKTPAQDMGRVNLAAVYMLKATVVMYQKDQSKYSEVASNLASVISSNEYELYPDFDRLWLLEGEFCRESILESNQASFPVSDWGVSPSNPFGFGTNLPCQLAPRNLKDPNGIFGGTGWSFAVVRPYLYKIIGDPVDTDGKLPIFEAEDVRRAASINYWIPVDHYSPAFQDTRGYFQRKYAARIGYSVAGSQEVNYCNNLRIYRYAETLLDYAELTGVLGASESGGVTAQGCLDKVRARAGVSSIAVTADNIELERHREFIGEGRRYWDLVRWGKAAQALTENFEQPSVNDKGALVYFTFTRTWTEKSKYLPIPVEEVNARMGTPYEIIQNPY
ncbi:MAG: RagB/SusD family nutrient uptake outer membrane protein [Bacteroidetes bacterium]|nr:RagB/SusD family nutrient uptake outer membrane protein [Bacteroidota bacterium]